MERIVELLGILELFANAFGVGESRTPAGNRIYQDYFVGDNALFSDSSNTEKRSFRTGLTFPHPDRPGEALFCTWHGKVRHMTLRLHFSWPISLWQKSAIPARPDRSSFVHLTAMAMGKRPAARQASPMWVDTADLPTSDGILSSSV